MNECIDTASTCCLTCHVRWWGIQPRLTYIRQGVWHRLGSMLCLNHQRRGDTYYNRGSYDAANQTWHAITHSCCNSKFSCEWLLSTVECHRQWTIDDRRLWQTKFTSNLYLEFGCFISKGKFLLDPWLTRKSDSAAVRSGRCMIEIPLVVHLAKL